MLIQFFTALREAQVPVSLREYLTLCQALAADLAALYEGTVQRLGMTGALTLRNAIA